MKAALTEAMAKRQFRNRLSVGEQFLTLDDQVLVEYDEGASRIPQAERDPDSVLTCDDIMDQLDEMDLDPKVKNGAGLMVKNLWEYHNFELSETTRNVNVGDWDKFAYPMVTIVYPNLVAHTLVSVQPMDGPISIIFYLAATYNADKGATAAGDDIITTPNANYASETIVGEQIGTGDGGVNYTGTVQWPGVRPSTISITDGTETFTDDGAGVLAGSAAGTGTIDYNTGAFVLAFNGAVGVGVAILMNYRYVQEGNPLVPEIDISLSQTPVEAERRSLMAKWTLEGAYNLKKIHGMDAEVELIASCTNELKFGLDQSIVTDIWDNTVAVNPVWSATPGAGISYAEHQLEFIKEMNQTGNVIFSNSGRAEGEWIVGGVDVATIVESLPGWDQTGKLTGRGIYKSGRLNNKWDFVKNSYFTATNLLMGSKGDTMVNTGYVWSPYLLFFTTNTIMLPDFLGRKGFATLSGKQMVDANFFCRGSVS